MLKKISLCLALILPLPLGAQTAPPGGKSLFNGKSALEALELTGTAVAQGKMEKVPVEGQSFKEALRLSTFATTTNPWDVQAHSLVPVAVKAGDVVLAQFWARAAQTNVESGEASSEFGFEQASDPWTKSASYTLNIGPQWRKFSIPFKVEGDEDAGKAQIYFRMGYRPQAFEVADLQVTDYGTTLSLDKLPQTKMTYPGMEEDAPWRKAALERIEKIRKGDLTVTVEDAAGNPVDGAAVTVWMTRHAFPFGTCVVAEKLATAGDDNDKYQKEVERLFNRVVFENELKWGPWEDGASNNGYWHRQYVEDALKWLEDRHIEVRGHNMVWGSWKWLPASLKALKDDPKALEHAIEERIEDVGGAMKGKVVEWDVVNEPVPEHDLTDILGKSAMVTWYQLAHKVDPKPLLFVNDYPSPDTTGHLDGYDEDIKYLLDNGAPLQGVGLQGHVGGTPWSIPALLQTLDKLGAHGLPVEITEFDTDIKDEQLDAQFFSDFLTAIFSHPSVNGFLMWGFWDGSHWHKKAPMFNLDWTEKPSGKVYEDLVFRNWWTDANGITDNQGTYKVRGFLGDYQIQVTKGGKTKTLQTQLGKGGLDLKVVLK